MAINSSFRRVESPSPASKVDEVIAAFTSAWRTGLCPKAEDWLDRFAAETSDAKMELIFREFCLAEDDGLAPDPDAYCRRFPEQAAALARLFAIRSLGSFGAIDLGSSCELPEVGDEIGPYLLIRELGRGSFARVFLAEQSDLASRPVVLKATTRPSPEPKMLARARHAHIVEVLHHAVVDDGAMQIVCMPFLGGATLAAVCAAKGKRRRSGGDLLERLDRVSAPEYPSSDVPRPAREILGRLSYARAVAWIFARLAEALDHAHRRGVAHGDVKPSNILLTADGLPMLFDFNLAVDWRSADPSDHGGGTLAYMPPERLVALVGASNGSVNEVPKPDLHRADLYSLGLVLVEMLTGVAPSAITPADPITSQAELAALLARSRAGGTSAFPNWSNLAIPAGLRPILDHCLAADPDRRYSDGRSLAEDLDRWRSDRSPMTAPDGPWPVPILRRIRRHRIPLTAMAITIIAATTVGSLISSRFRSTIQDEASERYSRILDKDDAGLFAFRQFSQWTPEGGDPADVAARKLNLYDVLGLKNWRDSESIAALPESDRDDLELLMLEQVYRIATAWSERPDSPDDWARGLALLDRESVRARNTSFDKLRLRLADQMGLGNRPRPSGEVEAPPWVERYLTGVAVERESARSALRCYESVSDSRPELLWPHYRAAAAAYRLSIYKATIRHLRPITEQRPDNPSLLTQLAAALLLVGEVEEAVGMVDRAIALNPDFVEAYRNRAIINGSLSVPGSEDVARFSLLQRNNGLAHSEKLGLETLVHKMLNDNSHDGGASLEIVHKILSLDPLNPDARTMEARILGRSGAYEKALDEFNAILLAYPDHLRARYDRAFVLRKLGRPEAIDEYDALIHEPRFEELYREDPHAIYAFHHVTNDRIKKNDLEAARHVAELGLDHSLRNRLYVAESLYHLGRVHAAAAKHDPSRLLDARERLRHSISLSPSLGDWFHNDPIFAEIRRNDPNFLRTESDAGGIVGQAP